MKLKTNGTKTNWWKWACLLILAINVAFVGVIASRLIQVREPAAQTITSKKAKSVKVGTVSTTRSDASRTSDRHPIPQSDTEQFLRWSRSYGLRSYRQLGYPAGT